MQIKTTISYQQIFTWRAKKNAGMDTEKLDNSYLTSGYVK